ncbi:tryptophan-rich sensory protein [Heliobacterium gestii]|uniref:Tryptophan-rich sensory protein n=1 Tax=Heliomicrobium gestii TaxID=2699 RepID=A0A845LAA4_HELGE|nr:tryptophan-rich sensory protein [Heliomicrobium gestii]MBM7866162.1 tryptophan-rich sensory protein [Heliomicrobium gestii]MZP42511.1 tryptophan-rich sensory protein [Heliomicrobium gestii]
MGRLSSVAVFFLAYVAFSALSWLFPMDRKWIESLEKPAWSPPGMVIGIGWVIIFALISLAVAILYDKVGLRRLGLTWKAVFLANWVFNQLFYIGQSFSRNLFYSFLDTAAIAVTAILLVFASWPYSRPAALLFAPYALWSSFATALAWTIYRLNR